jgi:hypothetical protein
LHFWRDDDDDTGASYDCSNDEVERNHRLRTYASIKKANGKYCETCSVPC